MYFAPDAHLFVVFERNVPLAQSRLALPVLVPFFSSFHLLKLLAYLNKNEA